MASSYRHPFGRKRPAESLEAAELLSVELRVFRERHHHALDPQGTAKGQIANERGRRLVRDTDPADPRVHAHVQREGAPMAFRHALQHVAYGGIDHRCDVARHRFVEGGLVEGPHEEDGLAHARLAQGQGLGQLDHREAVNGRHGFQDPAHVRDPQAVAVVLDDGQDGTRRHPCRHLGHVVPQIRRTDLDPGVERRVSNH